MTSKKPKTPARDTIEWYEEARWARATAPKAPVPRASATARWYPKGDVAMGVLVREMSDSHLYNTIQFLRRFAVGWAAPKAGTMFASAEGLTPILIRAWPVLPDLLKEAHYRGIDDVPKTTDALAQMVWAAISVEDKQLAGSGAIRKIGVAAAEVSRTMESFSQAMRLMEDEAAKRPRTVKPARAQNKDITSPVDVERFALLLLEED